MDFEQWQRVKEILNAAIELEPDERPAFFDAHCEEPWLRREVESLLESYESGRIDVLDRATIGAEAAALLSRVNDNLIGERLGSFKVESLLGSGGMGEVYLAEDTRLGRKVALKLLPAIYTNDPDRLRRFQQEARSASALNHPNIITVHEIDEVDGTNFISTEYVEGQTLRERMDAGRVPLDEVLDIAIQIASALKVAHSAGIVHRDIKPENVMLREDGYVKVLDFGLAKLTEQTDHVGVSGQHPNVTAPPMSASETVVADAVTQALLRTGTGAFLGTARYVSPEQARGLEVDTRTDIWSLGVVVYEMISGRTPFDGESVSDCIAAIVGDDPMPLTEKEPGVPQELCRVVGRCLEKEPERRLASARELVRSLKAIRQKLNGPREERGGFHVRWIAAAWAVVSLLLIAGAAVLFNPGPAAGPRPEIKSLAVLPFVDASGDAEGQEFADGVTEALIRELGQVSSLKVIGRSSVLRYQGHEISLPRIAEDLNVEAVIQGSVKRNGDRIQTAAKLTHAATGTQLWSNSYEREPGDVLTMQVQVVRDIADEIRVKLTPLESERLSRAKRVDPAAYDLYLKGKRHLDKRNRASLLAAIEDLEAAAAKDASFALPHAALSDAYFALGTVNISAVPPREGLEKGRASALRALELDAMMVEGQTALAVNDFYSWKWAEAEEGFKRAIELNPNYAPAHSWYAIYAAARGRLGEAIARIYRARELDPMSPHIGQNVGWILHYAKQYDEEIEQYHRVLEMDPNFYFARLRLASAYTRKGMMNEAIAELESVRTGAGQDDRSPATLGSLGYIYATTGRRQEAKRILNELTQLREHRYVNPSPLVSIYIGLGEKEKAFEYLEIAYREHSYGLVFLKVGSEYEELRGDPRFESLLKRVGHTQ